MLSSGEKNKRKKKGQLSWQAVSGVTLEESKKQNTQNTKIAQQQHKDGVVFYYLHVRYTVLDHN